MTVKPTAADVQAVFRRRYQHMLDRTVPHVAARWASLVGMLALYGLRVWLLQGWYIVTYGLGISLLNLFIQFITPQIDPDAEGGAPLLPVNNSADSEYKPFSRKLPEYKFWLSAMQAVVVAICLTVSRAFDVPVFWPILVFYFIVLFAVSMKSRVQHMIKHRYLPFAFGKKQYKEGGGGGKGRGGGGKKGDDAAPLNPAMRPIPYATIAEPRFTGSNLAR